MKNFVDFNDPFYRPLWVRVLIVGVTAAWSAGEFLWGSPVWGGLIGGISAYAFYGLFMAFNPRDPEEGPSDQH